MKSPWAASLAFLTCGGALLLGGCSTWNPMTWRSQSPEEKPAESKTQLVGDLAVPYGMFPVKVESFGLVTKLPGTGSDPPPSVPRAEVLADMKARSVAHPSELLASKNTAVVVVRGILRPGIQEGDRFDLEVHTAAQDETSSLRGGWLMETRLKEMAILQDAQIHEGRGWGIGEGAVLVDPNADAAKDRVLACRGRVLGGGRALRSRSLGLVLKPQHQNVFNASLVANAINKRFHKVIGGNIQEGVAKAHTDQYIELSVHPRYKDNIERYMQVVRSVGLRETPSQRLERMALLEKQLLDPVTADAAARQLEAVGRDGAGALKKGMASDNPEVRFRAAEALAYLDDNAAAKPLAEAARNQPAFRVFALTALSAMNDYSAYEQLCLLLDVPSAETRYGAFRAIWAMNPTDRRVRGEMLGDKFGYHVLTTTTTPMIHVTRSSRPEVVLFGQDQQFATPLLLEAGPRIRVTGASDGQVSVSKYSVGEADQKRLVSSKVDEVIRAVVELGGDYPDVVQLLEQAKNKGVLPSRFEVDALPEAGRAYQRETDQASESDATKKEVPGPFAKFFGKKSEKDPPTKEVSSAETSEKSPEDADSAQQPHPSRSSFAKITGRDAE